jgi:hypothetical protein
MQQSIAFANHQCPQILRDIHHKVIDMSTGGAKELHVLIIGAGVTGLLIAQGLKRV